ncbi:helix-turn-helix domain-containing protein [Streptomyces scopuliridis]|uniref:helix-turn-helix domain-containing protein n=1 Tax=Streptomyces scopuliridis TaxID=452529 RepID=UPI0036A50A6B
MKARTAALNQIGSILVSAPEAIRAKYSPLKSTDRADALARLRPSKNITLTTAARHLGVRPSRISDIERGTRRLDDIAHTYRDWLQTA